jgi:APA family basic amino acid/polyamine antiporter
VLLTTNTYDQLLSYVVFADWLFFGLTAGALLIVRRRDPEGRAAPGIAKVPGHPWTTLAFVAVAVGVVLNSFAAYPTQSLTGSAILLVAAVVFFVVGRPEGLRYGSADL